MVSYIDGATSMRHGTRYVGVDVHKDSIAVAVVEADGEERRLGVDPQPPEGTMLAHPAPIYTSLRVQRWRPMARANAKPLAGLPMCFQLPQWSPDGLRIAISAERHERGLGIDTDGERVSDPTRLTDIVSGPSWSPDGSKVLLSILASAWSTSMGPPVGASPLGGDLPAWSLDASRIAIASIGVQRGIDKTVPYTVAPDGPGVQTLVRAGLSLVAANSGYEDIATSRTGCAAGCVVAEPDKSPGPRARLRDVYWAVGRAIRGVYCKLERGDPNCPAGTPHRRRIAATGGGADASTIWPSRDPAGGVQGLAEAVA